MDILKDFNFLKFLVLIVPGAMMAIFRSFAIKGSFPTVGKDDFATFLLGSVVYDFFLASAGSDFALPVLAWHSQWSFVYWSFVLLIVPLAAGFVLGLVEAGDVFGRAVRKIGVRLPSPSPTAWETLFKEIPKDTFLLVTLKNEARIYGRWKAATVSSSASTDPGRPDLYLGEIGTIDRDGRYVPKSPSRGIYIGSEQIQFIEVVPPKKTGAAR